MLYVDIFQMNLSQGVAMLFKYIDNISESIALYPYNLATE